MKFLCYLLSLCLLSFSTIPCLDVATLLPEQAKEQLTAGEQQQDPCEHEQSEDDCSASCQCCHFHSILLTAEVTPYIVQQTKAGNEKLVSLLFSKNHFSIWHPPKA
ncbi:hypothetical protein [Nafulsella turpanensis]|uniref:hypothetical protein n=1 Tax=Nafulsella turpanensis TaxID=1265690 RepID=UPI0012680260|nr:hypothetical protein [Nafulsella turpanensis]